jgi:hypothetical protein
MDGVVERWMRIWLAHSIAHVRALPVRWTGSALARKAQAYESRYHRSDAARSAQRSQVFRGHLTEWEVLIQSVRWSIP